MSNELDPVYFTNHVHRILRPSDDAVGEASAHGLSLASDVQIGTTGAALKIFKLDSTGNLTTSNNFLLKGVGGATSNTVTVLGKLTVESGNGLVVNSQSGITVTSSNTGNVFMRLQRPTNEKDAFVHFTPSGTLSATNPEFRLGYTSGTTGLTINRFDGTTSVNMLTMTSAGLVNITSGVTISGNLNVTGVSTMSSLTTTGALTVGGKLTFTEYNHYTPSLSTEKGYWSNTAAGPVAVTGITTTGWYKIASITCPTSGAYRGANFKGSILRYNTNWGEAIPTELFFSGRIIFYNAPSTPLQDTGVLYLTEGFNDNLLRLVKVADASWELQLGAYTQNVAIAWEVEPLYLGSQVTFTHFDRAAASLPVSIVTPTTQYHSRVGDTLGRSLDLTSTLVVDGRTDINNQFFVSTTNDQIAGFTGSGTASTGSLSLYYYKRDNATPYIQDKTLLYLGSGQTGGLIYSVANSSASHLWHVGGFNSTSSERMRLSNDGLRINLASDLTTNGAAASDDLQVGGNTYLNGRLSVNSNGGMLRLIGTDHSYIELYTTGTSARSGFLGFASASNKNLTIVNSEVTGNLALSTNNLTRVFVTSGGEVGINTSSPASGLDVNANSVFRSGVTISGALSVTGASTLRGNANFLGNVVVGTGTSSFDLDVDGLARAKSYISSQTVSSAGSTNLWFELGYSTLTAAYADETVCLLVSNRGGSNSNDTAGMAQVIFRVKQPNVLTGNPPVVDLLVPWSAGVISSQDFVAVVTQDDASAKVIKLMARLAPNFDELRYTVFNQTIVNNTNEFTLNYLPTGSATLITGVTSYTGIGGFYTSSTGAVGIGTVSPASGLDVAVSSVFRDGVTTSGNTFLAMQTAARVGVNTTSPASGLDVNDNAVFRSGVTISGALSLNTITTTGTINANSLNVSGNASITGTLSVTGTTSLDDLLVTGAATFRNGVTVSGLTSLNTLTTTGVVNANSLNISGNASVTGTLGVSGLTSLNTLTTTGVVNANSLNVGGNASVTGTLGVSGLTSLNTLTTTGVVNANSLNVSGNASVTGTLGVSGTTSLDDMLVTGASTFRSGVTVSGLTSLNTLTTTGVVNANSLNVSGDSIISGNLGVYNTATFENLVADQASTNLALRSQDFSTIWTASTVTVATSSAGDTPTGSGTSNSLTATSSDSSIQQTISVTPSSTYTFSVWLRGTANGTVEIQIQGFGTDLFACNYTTSWQRFSVTRTIPAGQFIATIRIGGNSTFSSPEVLYAWGAQFENKPYATSYIPTVAAAVSAGDALELKYPLSRTVVANNLEVTGTLGVSGLTSLNTLTTTGVVNANSLNVSGNASVTGTLGVSGLTSLNTLTTTGVVNAYSLNVSGNASVTGTLSVSGTTSLDDMLVTGAATFRTGVTVSGTLQANNVTGIVVSGNSSAGSGVGMIIKNDAALGSAYLALISETNSGNVFQNGGTLNLSSPTNVRTLSNTFLAVSGSSTFFSANNTDASFRNNLTVSGALAVSGTSTLRGNLGVSGTTTLSRTVTTVTIPAGNIPTVTTSVTILGKFALIRVSAPSVVISTAANTEPIISGLPVTFDLDQEFIVRVTHNSTPIATLAKVFHNGSAIAIYKNLNGDTNFSTSESVSWAALTFLVAIQ